MPVVIATTTHGRSWVEIRSALPEAMETEKHLSAPSPESVQLDMRGILAAKKSSKKLLKAASSSVHSEDSTSSKEERKKRDEGNLDTEIDFSGKEKKCLSQLRAIRDVPGGVLGEVEELLRLYSEAVDRERKGRTKAESELLYKLEKMTKYLQSAEGIQDELNRVKLDLEKKEEETKALKIEVDESHKREQDLYDEKKSLIQKIEQLDRDLDKRQLEDKIHEGDVRGKTRENYIKEIGRLKRELDIMEGRFFKSQSECKILERNLREKEKDFSDMEELVKTHKYEVMKHEQKRKVTEADLERAQGTMSHLKASIGKHYETFKKAAQELMKKDEENFELRKSVKNLEEKLAVMTKYVIELRDRLEYLSKVYFELEDQNTKLKSLCSNQTGTLEVIKKQSIDVQNFQDKWIRRLEHAKKKEKVASADAQKLHSKLVSKVKEMKHHELVAVKLNKRIKELQKEKDICLDEMKKISDSYTKQKDILLDKEKVINDLREECEHLKQKVNRQSLEIEELYKYSNILQKDMKALEGQKKVTEGDLRAVLLQLIQSEKQFQWKNQEAKRFSTNHDKIYIEMKAFERKYIESKSFVKDNELKVRHLCDEISKYKQQLHINDNIVERLQRHMKRVKFDHSFLNKTFKQGKQENETLQLSIKKKENEIELLNRLIGRGERRGAHLAKEVERLRNQVAQLKTRVQNQNKEVRLVQEKAEMLSFMIDNGKSEINQRSEDIRLLKIEILNLRTENSNLKKILERNRNLRKRVISLEMDLSVANQKFRALEEQMENPVNVHRWRLLETNDPNKKELIHKNRILLKKLLKCENKNNELKDKLQNLEKSYATLRNQMEKIPCGNDCVMKLQESKRLIRAKTEEIQRLTAEIGSYYRELKEVRKEMEENKMKSEDCMKKYYELKKICEEKFGRNLRKMLDKEHLYQNYKSKIVSST